MRHFSHLPAFLPVNLLKLTFPALSALIGTYALLALTPVARAQVREFDFQEFQFDQQIQPAPQQSVPENTPANAAFYSGARRLIQEQINLVSRTRKAMTTVDPNAIRAVDGQIVLHGTKINRFIAENYRIAPPNCGATSTVASVAAQDTIACNLIANAEAFNGLQNRLFSRLNMLSGISEVNRLPLVSGERVVTNSGVPLFIKGSFKEPSPTIVTKAPDIPAPPNSVLGRPVKSALGDYRAPISPAIAAPQDVSVALNEIVVRLDEARSLYLSGAQALNRPAPRPVAQTPAIAPAQTAQTAAPAQTFINPQTLRPEPVRQTTPTAQTPTAQVPVSQAPFVAPTAPANRYPSLTRGFTDPDAILARADAASYDVQPADRLAHQQFLTNPHTGITQVLTRREHVPDPNLLRNRLDPTPAERYPYAILVDPQDPPLPQLDGALEGRLAPFDTQRFPFVPLEETSFRPRLAMQIDGNEFNLITSGLDYGFMIDMGTLNGKDLNSISAGLPADQLNLRSDIRDFFLNYKAPDKLQQLMTDRRRFLSGKMGPNNLPSLLSPESKVEVGHTYLLRTLQFEVPDAIANGTPISYAQRRDLARTLNMPAKDLLVVFRPVKSRENGTYTVLWRVLGEFAEPEVTDLAQYAQYEGGIIGQGVSGIRR